MKLVLCGIPRQNLITAVEGHYQLMHMIKKRQIMVEEGDEGLTAAEQFYSLAA